ncbi:YdeI/OmpD-associated family protein [Segetibacter koreensis]|uniref:YdeI/OmpD-associated family protein n=1 Tax=Segetibacter koreensis TaxID=398037 RepID=UPI00036EEB19|nr:YdeI/OmpD-associated family protein [Segetibacter koreensis]
MAKKMEALGHNPVNQPSKIKLRAQLELRGKTATGFVIPENNITELGAGKKPQIHVNIKGHTYRTSIASMGGEFMLPVSAEVRTNAGVNAGEVIDLELELDTEPREVVIPDDLKKALEAKPDAKKYFESLSYSNKRRLVIPIEDAKTPETRQRRIEKTVTLLIEGKA